ncbi:MAG: NAD-dependent epimerase/dehydratase family protein [Saprospiraceae bacterium]
MNITNFQKNHKFLVTGAAGFIGYHLCQTLASIGYQTIGLDNINNYYDPKLKYNRLLELGFSNIAEGEIIQSEKFETLRFIKTTLENKPLLETLFEAENFTQVCHLAAQAGVRYSLDNPHTYIQSNIVGFVNILECCRHFKVDKIVYASSSSVYGLNNNVPFRTTDPVDKPISIYAATKRSNELMAYTYSHLFGLKTIGLRFFTVYGPWGRPDMAMFLFTDAILNNYTLNIFNNGELSRDFTFIDDIITGVVAILTSKSKYSNENWQIYNIGNNKPVRLLDFIEAIEICR